MMTKMMTKNLIQALSPRLPDARAAEIASGLAAAAREADITTVPRVAAFVAQLAHESAGFKYLEEIWGNTPAQKRYEGRRDLGNVRAGDGYRYRGRGWIQLTGRANYQAAGRALGIDLETQPDLAARPDVAARIAAWYWRTRGLNRYADSGDFRELTRRINGGYNGLSDRERYHRLALEYLMQHEAEHGRVLLVPTGGGQPVLWDGKPARYGGELLTPELVAGLRLTYPKTGGPWQYKGLRIWRRTNGDLVLERA